MGILLKHETAINNLKNILMITESRIELCVNEGFSSYL